MKIINNFLILVLIIVSCKNESDFDIQGHRGFRGLYPENSVIGFKKSIDIGVNTIELDVVISKDNKVVVSHEPWISSHICVDGNLNQIKEDIYKYNTFDLKYDQIKTFDCGIIGNKSFPNQKKISSYKPTLNEVIHTIEKYSDSIQYIPQYNIEIKSSSLTDGIFHPEVGVFSQLVLDIVKKYNIQTRVTIQSFDFRVLQYINNYFPDIRLSLLVSENYDVKKNLKELGFNPHIFSPEFIYLNEEDIMYLKEKKIKIIPWTVNSYSDIANVLKFDIDGIISDYPDRVIKLKKLE